MRSRRVLPFAVLALTLVLVLFAQPAHAWQADRPSHDVTCSTPPGPICPWTFSYNDKTQDPLGPVGDHNSYSPSGDADVALGTETVSYQQNFDGVTNRDDYAIRIMAAANSRQSHVMPAPTYHGWSTDPNACAQSSPAQGCINTGINTQNGGTWVNLPFTFFHYGQAYNSIFICSNGYAAFAYSKTATTCPIPPITGVNYQMFGQALDSNGNILGIPSSIMAPYMKPLNAGWQNAKIYYRTTVPPNAVLCPPSCGDPTAPAHIFGISWFKVQEQNAQTRSDCWPCENTFSLILDQFGNIWFWWDSNTFNPFGGGSSHGVIGVNDGSGTMSTLGDWNSAQTNLGLNMRDPNYPAPDPNHPTPPANQFAWLNDLKITFDDPNTADTLNPTGRGGLYGHNIQTSPPPQTCDSTCKAAGVLVENGIVIGLCFTTGFVCIAVTAADIAFQLSPYIGSMPVASFGSQPMNSQCPSGQTSCQGYIELPTKQDDGLCNCATDASALLLLVDWIVPHDMNAHALTINFGAELGQYSGGNGFGDTSHTRGWSRITLAVDAGDFQFNSVTPQTSNSVPAGQSINYNVNIGLNSQAQSLTTISLSTAVSGPTGGTQPTVTFSPTNTVVLNGGQSGSVTITIATGANTPTGSYNITLTGEDPTHALLHSTTFTIKVVPPPDFTISASPSSATVQAGTSATSSISIGSLNNFAGIVTLSATEFPATGLSCSFNPPTITGSGTSTMTCSGSGGTYTVTVTGTSGSLSHTTTVTITIKDLTLIASPNVVPPDSTTTSTVTVQLLDNAPGVTVTFSTSLGTLSSTNCTTGSAGSCSITIKSGQTGLATITATAPNYPSHQVTVTFTGSLAVSSITSSVPATITVQTSNSQANVLVSLTTTLGTLSASSCTTGTTGSCSITITSTSSGSATITATAAYYSSATTTLTVPSLSLSAGPTVVPADSSTTSTIMAQTSNNLQGVTISFSTTGGALSAATCTTGSTGSCSVTVKSGVAGTFTVTGSAQYYASGQTNVAFVDFGITTSPLSIDGTNGAFCNSLNNMCSTVITTQNQNDIIIAYTLDSLDTRTGCTFSIGDTAGLAWNIRTTVPGRPTGSNGANQDQIAEFWARSPGKLSSDIITEGVFCSPSGYGGEIDGLVVFGVNGANFNSPFDSSLGTASGNNAPPSATLSTGNPNDLIISAALQSGLYQTVLGPAPGFNLIAQTTGSCFSTGSSNFVATGVEYGFSSFPLSNFPVRFSDCAPGYWEQIADAIAPASSYAVNVGTSVGSSILLYSVNGFSGTVSLSDTVPAGLTCNSISPSSVFVYPSSPGVATISCSSNIGGNYPVTVTATSGTLAHVTTIHVIENDFSLSASPNTITVVANLQGATTININGPAGVTPTIYLSTSISPSTGLTCNLNPTSVTLSGTGPSASTLSCSGSIGTYTVTVTGSSNGLIRSTAVTITVQDFSLQISSNQLTVNAGSTGSLTVTVASLNNYAGTISFSSSAPWCLYYNFNPASIALNAGGSSTASFSISPVGACSGAQYSITITASGPGGAIHSLSPITATIPGYTVSVSPSSQTIPAARSGSYTVTVTSVYGYSGTIAFSIPPGALTGCAGSSFQPATLTLASGGTGSTTLTISPAGSCPASSAYPYLYAQDSAKGITQTASFNLIISTFAVSINYPTVGVVPGATAYYTVTITSLNNYPAASIYLGFASALPCASPVSWNNQLSLPSGGSVSTQIAYTVAASCSSPQSFTLISFAQDNAYPSVTATASINVTVGSFTITPAQTSMTVYIGSSGSLSFTVYPYYGKTDTLSLTASGLPSCAGSSFSPSTIGLPNGGSSTIAVSASTSCTSGSYTVALTAQGPTTIQTTTFTLVIANPPSGGGGGGGGSVAYGSLVTLADGSKIPVQDLKVGDVMLGYDPTTGQFTTSTILSITAVQTTNMMIIHTQSGVPFRVDANPRQTLWVKTPDGKTGWMPVTQIQPGDYLLTPIGWTMVTSIEFAPAGSHTMFDIIATMPYFTDNYLDPMFKT